MNDSIPANSHDTLADLSTMSLNELIDKLLHGMVVFAINLTVAILVFYIGKLIIRKIHAVLASIFIRKNVDSSLSTFILSLVKMVLYFLLVVIVIGILGIETSSFIALFASAGVAIGMALSGTLQNFAGGVLILILKPYRVGDYIEAQGFAGTVTEIQIFHTIICTYDNKSIIIPNGGLSTGSINNWSREDYRRVEWGVSISYGDDVEAARKAILDIFASDSRIIQDSIEADRERLAAERAHKGEECVDGEYPDGTPCDEESTKPRTWIGRLFHRRTHVKAAINEWETTTEERLKQAHRPINHRPAVWVKQLNNSSVDLSARAWVRTSNYWPVFYELNERIYAELPKCGVTFPFPQMDVHLKDNN